MRHWIGLVSCAVLLVGCGSTIQTGSGGSSDGGAPASNSEPGAPAATLAPEARASQYFTKCSLGCEAPKDGPCATADVIACINKCTATLEGLAIACAQCLVENSGYTGERCDALGVPGEPVGFGPGPRKALPEPTACPEGETCPQPPQPPLCTEALERCDGFTMAKTTGSTCTASCR